MTTAATMIGRASRSALHLRSLRLGLLISPPPPPPPLSRRSASTSSSPLLLFPRSVVVVGGGGGGVSEFVAAAASSHNHTLGQPLPRTTTTKASRLPLERRPCGSSPNDTTCTPGLRRRYLSSASSSAAASSEHDDDLTLEEDVPSCCGAQQHYYTPRRRSGVRNVAIVAHVDHGKTTLVDKLLRAAEETTLTVTSTPTPTPTTVDNTHADATAGQAGSALDQQQPPDSSTSEGERLMDTGELERERGITITSKVTRLDYVSSSDDTTATTTATTTTTVINVVDTPGHSDFSGEVDRILSTVDGVVLLVDAGEGPKSQTKYVLGRALSLGLTPICVLNKCDRVESAVRVESGETESELLDLFDGLGANAGQMEYRTLYGSARGGWITDDVDVALSIAESSIGDGIGNDGGKEVSMKVLLDAILEDIPPPAVHSYAKDDDDDEEEVCRPADAFHSDPFSMTATTVGYDQYLGRTCTGRIYSGRISINDAVSVLRRDDDDLHGEQQPQQHEAASAAPSSAGSSTCHTGPTSTVTGIFANRGVSRTPLDPPVATAGDIITLTGVPDTIRVGDTLTTPPPHSVPRPISTPPLAPPTLSCYFGANNGPLVGREGKIVTSSRIRARLVSETDNNVTITVTKSETDSEKTVVYGRGELQLGILIEQMRREGYEMIISPPTIVTKICPATGQKMEPYEEVTIDVDAEYAGTVVNALTGSRRGVLLDMSDDTDGKTRLVFEVPSRGLLGLGPEMATATRGTAVMHHCYLEDREYARTLLGVGLNNKGKLVSNDSGRATLFALENLSQRGTLFVAPGDVVYPGMVIGELTKATGGVDLDVNPVRAKATTNMRTQSKEEKLYLAPPRKMTVEELIGYMNEDEIIEVTPQSVRLRKAELDGGARERAARVRRKQMKALADAGRQGGGRR